jgi:hypothetical protein
MATRVTFANFPNGLQPIPVALDTAFDDVLKLTIIPCTATGTNTIALTPISSVYPPNLTAYASYMQFSFVPANSTTGSATVNVNGIGAKNLYLIDGTTQVGSGDLVAGRFYTAIYSAALNSNAGGFYATATPLVSPTFTGTMTAAAANFSGAVDVAGNFSVATNKLTVAAASGNTVVAGALAAGTTTITSGASQFPTTIQLTDSTHATGRRSVIGLGSNWQILQDTAASGTKDFGLYSGLATAFAYTIHASTNAVDFSGNFSVATNKFTVAAASGNTVVAGTLGVTGATALAAATATSINKVALTAPATSATLTIADGTTLTQTTSTSIGRGQYQGTATNDAATAGNIGEYISSSVLLASAVSLSAGVAANVTSISLTAGDWDVEGAVHFEAQPTTQINYSAASIGSASATFGTTAGLFAASAVGNQANYDDSYETVTIPRIRVSLSGTTTYYLVAKADWITSTYKAFGIISARRVR